MAERDSDLGDLSQATRIPRGTLRNATRDRSPQPVSLRNVYRIGRALELPVAELVDGNSGEGVPDEPPHQPTQPKGPSPRPDRESRKTGPKRAQSRSAA